MFGVLKTFEGFTCGVCEILTAIDHMANATDLQMWTLEALRLREWSTRTQIFHKVKLSCVLKEEKELDFVLNQLIVEKQIVKKVDIGQELYKFRS